MIGRPTRGRSTKLGVAAFLAVIAAIGPVDAASARGPERAAIEPPGHRALAEHVVLIGFDGFDPDYLGRAPTPNLDALAARGVRGTTSGVMLPVTNPSFTAITTGAWPERSGNLAYWWDKAANTYRGQSRANDVTSIAEAVLAGGGTVASAQYFILQGNGADYGNPEALYTQPGGSCGRHFDDAISMLRREPVLSGGATVTVPQIPTLLAVYCGDLDAIGHAEGAESPNLGPALVELDRQVGRLVDALEEAGIADRTSIVLTGDHGMSTYTRSFALPLNDAITAAGFTPQFLFFSGQAVDPATDVVLVPAGRSMNLYLAGDLEGDAEALATVRHIADRLEGTGRTYDEAEQRRMHMDPRYGDLIIESAPGWAAALLPPDGPRGAHGSSAEVDTVYLMAGAGIAHKRVAPTIRHIDVGPTIARLLGLPPLPEAQGRVLNNVLDRRGAGPARGGPSLASL